MEKLRNFYMNPIVSFISTYLPLLIIVNHFTNSMVICLVVFFIYGMIAATTPLDIPLNLLFSVAGCILVAADGYAAWIVALYFLLVIPKIVLFFLVATRFK